MGLKKVSPKRLCQLLIDFSGFSSRVICIESIVAHLTTTEEDFQYYLDQILSQSELHPLEHYDQLFSQEWRQKAMKFTNALLEAYQYSDDEKSQYRNELYVELMNRESLQNGKSD